MVNERSSVASLMTVIAELNTRNRACSKASCFVNPNFFIRTLMLSMITCVLMVGRSASSFAAIWPLGELTSRAYSAMLESINRLPFIRLVTIERKTREIDAMRVPKLQRILERVASGCFFESRKRAPRLLESFFYEQRVLEILPELRILFQVGLDGYSFAFLVR